MCEYPWSNRDTYNFVPTCHIYEPINIFFNSLILFFAIICFCNAIHAIYYQKRKEIPIATFAIGLAYILTYSITLGLRITFADRNLGLNILNGLCHGTVWIALNLRSYRHLEIIMSVDNHTKAKYTHFHTFIKKCNIVVCMGSIVFALLQMIIPTVIVKEIDIYTVAGPSAVILTLLNMIPRLYYGWKLRSIIVSALKLRHSKDSLYLPIKKQLDRILISAFIGTLVTTILTTCALFVPILRSNLYIVYNVQVTFVPISGLIGLHDNRWKAKHSPDQNLSNEGESSMLGKNKVSGGSKSGSGGAVAVTASRKKSGGGVEEISMRGTAPSSHNSNLDEVLPLVEEDKENSLIKRPESPKKIRKKSGAELEVVEEVPRHSVSSSESLSPPIWNPYTSRLSLQTSISTEQLSNALVLDVPITPMAIKEKETVDSITDGI